MTALGAALGGAGLVLAVLAVAGARAPAAPVPDYAGYLPRWSHLHGGYRPAAGSVTDRWLRAVHVLAAPLARRGVPADVLTLLAAWLAALALVPADAHGHWVWFAVPAVVASGVMDNLDGAVAALTDRASAFGFVFDSVVDRIADALYLAALYLVGAPGPLCVAAGAAIGLQEYLRARAGAVGFREIGVVTPGERPTRVLVTALALAAVGTMPRHATLSAGTGAAVLLGLAIVSTTWLGVVIRRRLSGGQLR